MAETLAELLVRIGGQVDASFPAAMTQVKKSAEETTNALVSIGAKTALAFSAVGGAGLALTKTWIDAAAQMEQYKATLTAIMKSSEAAQQKIDMMVKFAASTPFDVQGIVQAGVTIKSLGLDIDQMLTPAGDLAAVMGRSIPEAALALSKAASGSLDGVTMLADSWGISRRKMIEFGAAANDQGEIQVKTAAQVEKLRNALMKIIATDYGGAMDAQSKTLTGAFSNLGDSISQMAAALGAELAPFVTSVTRSLSELLGMFQLLPGPVKTFIAYGTAAGALLLAFTGFAVGAAVSAVALAAGVVSLGGALGVQTAAAATSATATSVAELSYKAAGMSALGAVPGIGALSAAMFQQATAAGASAAATGATGGVFSKAADVLKSLGGTLASSVGGTLARVGGQMLAFATGPVGLVVAAVVGIGVAAKQWMNFFDTKTPMNAWEAESMKTGQALTDQSKKLQQTAQEWRRFQGILNGVTNGQASAAMGISNMTQRIETMRKVMQGANQSDLMAALRKEGYTSESLKAQSGDLAKQVSEQRQTLMALNTVERGMAGMPVGPDGQKRTDVNSFLLSGAIDKSQADLLYKMFGTKPITAEALSQSLADTKTQLSASVPLLNLMQTALDRVTSYDSAMDSIAKKAGNIKNSLELSDKLGVSGGPQQRLQQLNAQMAKLAGDTAGRMPTDPKGLTEWLNSDKRTAQEKTAGNEYASLLALRKQIEDQIRQEAIKTHQDVLKSETDLARGRLDAAKSVVTENKRLGRETLSDHINVSEAAKAVANAEYQAKVQALTDAQDEAKKKGGGSLTPEQQRMFTNQRRVIDDEYRAATKAADEDLAEFQKQLELQKLNLHKDVLSARSASLDLEMSRLQNLASRGVNVEQQMAGIQAQRLQMAVRMNDLDRQTALAGVTNAAQRAAIEEKFSIQEGNIRQRFYQDEAQRQYERAQKQHDFLQGIIQDERQLAVEVAKFSHDVVAIKAAEAQRRAGILQKIADDARKQGYDEVAIARKVSLQKQQFWLEDQKAKRAAEEAIDEEITRITKGDVAADLLRIQRQLRDYAEQGIDSAKLAALASAKRQEMLKKETDATKGLGDAASSTADSFDKMGKAADRIGGANSPLLTMEEAMSGFNMFSRGASKATTSTATPPGQMTAAQGAAALASGAGAGAGGKGTGVASSVVSQLEAALLQPNLSDAKKQSLTADLAAWKARAANEQASIQGAGTVAGQFMSPLSARFETPTTGQVASTITTPTTGVNAAQQAQATSAGVGTTGNAGAGGTQVGPVSLSITINGQTVSGDVKDPQQLRKGMGHLFGATGLEKYAAGVK